jgi:hypothetical protein
VAIGSAIDLLSAPISPLPIPDSPEMHLLTLLSLLALSRAQVTVYNTAGTAPLSTPVPTAYVGDQAFNPLVLDPPPVPDPSPPSTFSLQLQNGGYTGLSISQPGSFLGFSLEFAVASQIG